MGTYQGQDFLKVDLKYARGLTGQRSERTKALIVLYFLLDLRQVSHSCSQSLNECFQTVTLRGAKEWQVRLGNLMTF